MTRLTWLVLAGLLIHSAGWAMIRTLPFPELVKTAEIIVIAKVTEQAPDPAATTGVAHIKNVLTLDRCLKGEWAKDAPLTFLTIDGKGKRLEDAVAFPPVGERVVLFLKKGTDGALTIINRVQGLWPLQKDTDKTLGMGFRYSVEMIEKEVQGKSQ